MSTSRRALALGLVWLLWIWAVAIASARTFTWMDGPNGWTAEASAAATPLCRWDSGWYVGLADHGYGALPTRVGEETNHAFFPLYPLLMRAVSSLPGVSTPAAGNLISAACLLALLPLLSRWAERHLGRERALPAVTALLAFPTAFFFASVYTEALVVLLSLLAVDAIETDRPARAAAAGFLAGLSRISGLLLAPYLLLLALRRPRGSRAASLLAALSPAAGFATFCLYFHFRFGDARLFVRAQHNWSRQPKTVWDGPLLILRTMWEDVSTGALLHKSPIRTLEGVYLALFAALALVLLRYRRGAEAVYVGLTVGIVLASGTLESAGRYVLPAFPAFALIAGLHRHPRTWRLVVAGSLVVQAVTTFAFVHWLWAG